MASLGSPQAVQVSGNALRASFLRAGGGRLSPLGTVLPMGSGQGLREGGGSPQQLCFPPYKECTDPENHKVRQKLKAKEWDEYLAKGKRFRVLQPVMIGCVWAADGDSCSGAELKVLQQFTACLLETVASEEEQAPKASKRERRDQQSEWGLLPTRQAFSCSS